MYRIQVKHDTLHSKYHLLSVKFRACESAERDIRLYIAQYAIDHQMNPHQIGGQVIDSTGRVMSTFFSNAYHNKVNDNET